MSFHPVDRPLGNLRDFALGSRALERIPIPSDAMGRRLVRLVTSVGDLGVQFAGETRLRDGDVLFADGERVIAVEVLPDDVLIVRPRTIAEAIAVAHALGNRHVPIQTDGAALVVRYAPPLAELIATLGIPVERRALAPAEPFAYAAAPHAH